MFLSQLKFQQKRFFLNLAHFILNVDGEFDTFESNYLRAICAEMSLSNNDAEECKLEELSKLFISEEEKKILLMEIIALALCNGEYDKKEKVIIDKIAADLNLTSDIETICNMVDIHFRNQINMIKYIFDGE